jgi:hypothetical protein
VHDNIQGGGTPFLALTATSGLIRIKARADRLANMEPQQQREQVMPAGEILFVTAFIIAFGVFAFVLGWADQRTRHLDH